MYDQTIYPLSFNSSFAIHPMSTQTIKTGMIPPTINYETPDPVGTFINTYMCMYTCIYICIHVCIYTEAYTYRTLHTCTYTSHLKLIDNKLTNVCKHTPTHTLNSLHLLNLLKDCDLDYVPNKAIKHDVKVAISDNLGR